jgi:hypothetical protein
LKAARPQEVNHHANGQTDDQVPDGTG